jgi:hypothetical protein
MRYLHFGFLAFVLLLLTAACSDDTPTEGPVTIVTQADFSGQTVVGTFEVTEGADVLQCSDGTFEDEFVTEGNILKVFTCESGSNEGTFTATFAPSDSAPGPGDENGPWSVVESSGDFVGLEGGGDFSVVYATNGANEGVETLTGDIKYSAAPATAAAPATTTTAAPPTASGGDLGEFEPFADGTYTMGQLGVPVTFTVTGEWHTQPVGPGFFVITTPDSRGPGDHDIVAMAPTQLFDAATGEPLPADDDLAGWLDSVPATATISEVTVGEIGGFETTVFTVDTGDEIVYFVDVDGEFGMSFDSGFIYEVHWVEHPDGPIAFVIGTPIDDLAWLDTARSVVETIELG